MIDFKKQKPETFWGAGSFKVQKKKLNEKPVHVFF